MEERNYQEAETQEKQQTEQQQTEQQTIQQAEQPTGLKMQKAGVKKRYQPASVLKVLLIVGMCVFTALSIAYYSRANFTRTVYRNYTYTGVNAYVGGDAYNYIINGTYFTGYSVIGTGFMVSAVACGIGAAVVGLKEQEEKRKEAKYDNTDNKGGIRSCSQS